MLGICFSICAAFSKWLLALRINIKLGIPDLIYLILTDTLFGSLGLAMGTLPMMAMFAKITPKKIEGTVFAFLTGTTNLSKSVLAPMIGVWINSTFVGVTTKDLSKYSTLCLIVFVCSFLTFLILPLVPLKSQIKEWREQRLVSNLSKDEHGKKVMHGELNVAINGEDKLD